MISPKGSIADALIKIATWQSLQKFLTEVAPSVAESAQPVDPKQLTDSEELFGTLPSRYRNFLEFAGAGIVGWHPFGPKWSHHFHEIWEDVKTDLKDVDNRTFLDRGEAPRYLPVALNQDSSSITPMDYYLDLRNPDGLMCEFGSGYIDLFDEEMSETSYMTMMDRFRVSIFTELLSPQLDLVTTYVFSGDVSSFVVESIPQFRGVLQTENGSIWSGALGWVMYEKTSQGGVRVAGKLNHRDPLSILNDIARRFA